MIRWLLVSVPKHPNILVEDYSPRNQIWTYLLPPSTNPCRDSRLFLPILTYLPILKYLLPPHAWSAWIHACTEHSFSKKGKTFTRVWPVCFGPSHVQTGLTRFSTGSEKRVWPVCFGPSQAFFFVSLPKGHLTIQPSPSALQITITRAFPFGFKPTCTLTFK